MEIWNVESLNNNKKESRAVAQAFLLAEKDDSDLLGLRSGERSLSDFYAECLGPVLSDKVRGLLDSPHDEQVSLFNELAHARANYGESLRLARLLHEEGNEKLTLEAKALLIQTMTDAAKEVKDLTLAASRIEKEAQDKVSPRVIGIILTRVMMAINDVCGTEHIDIAVAIKQTIDRRIRSPLCQRIDPVIQVNLLDAGE